MYVYIEIWTEAMIEMKIYKKPEIEIVEFSVADITNAPPYVITSNEDFPGGIISVNGDEVFYGIEAGEEGYLVGQ